MAKGGNVKVRFGAETRDLERGAARAGRAVDTFARRGTKAGGLLGTSTKHLLAYAGGITSIAAAAVAAKDAVKFTEDLAKSSAALARTTGLDVKTASEWVEISKVRGVQAQALNRGFITLAKNIRQVEQGSKTATRAFADLGVSQKTLASGDTNRILLETADAFKRMPDGVKQAAIAQQIFGRQSQALIPLLNQGSTKLREQLGLVDQYGVALDRHGVKQALQAVEAQRKWQLALDGIKVQLGQAVIPALTVGITKVTAFVAQMRSGQGAGGEFAAKLKDIWKGAKPVVEQLGKIVTAVGKFAAAHPGLTKVAGALLAAGVAVKTITFASQITGIGKLIRLAGTLGSVAVKGGTALANGIANAFFPTWARRAGGIKDSLKRTISRAGVSAGEGFASSAAGSIAGGAGGGGLAGKVGRSGVTGKLQTVFGGVGKVAGLAFKVAFVAMLPDLVSSIADQIKQKFPEVSQYSGKSGWGELFRDWANAIAGGLGRRRGGMVFQGGGTVPALVSSGEVIVEPGGSAWRAPGPPVAADNVPAMLKPGSAVLTWDGQARMMAGQSLASAVRDQAPHFRAGGYATWTKVGASVYGGTPNDDNGKGSVGSNLWRKGAYPFAELNWGHALGGLPDYAKLYIRRGSRAVVGTNEDIGPSYSDRQIDLHKQIAVALGISPTSFLGPVQIMNAPAGAKPGPVDPRTLASTGTGASTSGSRTIRTTTYAPPSPGTNRSSRATFDAGYEQGTSDPSNFGLGQARSDFYNQARSSIFGTWTTSTRTIPGRRRAARPQARPSSGGGPAVRAGDSYVNDRGQTFKISAKDAPNLAWWHKGRVAIAKWIYPQLAAARKAGWDGRLNTGWRSYEHQYDIYFRQGIRPAAYPGTSNHEGSIYPKGAIDVASARSLRDRLRGWHGPGQRLKWALDVGFNDPPHFSATGYRQGGFVLGKPGTSTGRAAPSPRRPGRTTGRAVRETQRTPRQAAYAGLWALLNVGIGKRDQAEVKRRLAHELKVIDGLSYDDLRVFAADAKAIYNRPWGADSVSKTEKARVAQIIKYADTAIGRSIGRAVGVTEDVRDSIAGTEGRIDNQLKLAGIDPEKAAGRQIKAAADTSAIGRLQARRQALVTARQRAVRAGRRDIAQNITGEITAVDDQILGLRVAIQDLTSTVGNATETAEQQLEQQRQTNELLQGQLDSLRRSQAVSQSQYGVLAQAIADIASGQIGGRLGLASQAAGTPGEVARY